MKVINSLAFSVLLAQVPLCFAQIQMPDCATLISHAADRITTVKAENDPDDIKRQQITQALENLNIPAQCTVEAKPKTAPAHTVAGSALTGTAE